ncbi:hypothetical protein DDB_G0287527 [Dictyostelium discoideum AX4]|uniref:Putative uncharacterized protein DDB_G0287527 n=1 Tax=Dictyostelium discoideum TaxID=44689 RepID=Y8750_DICDI|nr:hypothetical protein DDB_G0287527 [Dictyostelium discoideum AX4]Q54K87.1 RecName: Full=Putative uncharacterized protein DDB_G0287527 [Dictyostelium discoideum]EAL63663.1 hypothetical protein DDB_G0287527 [Dictyostelium discoideum AX4]|eukprot:XP_637168.1 hypothetical protein DDB_G0287527 [Dictyostelium discoideum AX4]
MYVQLKIINFYKTHQKPNLRIVYFFFFFGLETFFSIINPNDLTFFNYVIGVNNLDLTKKPNSSVDELIYFFDYLDSCWSSLMKSSNQNSKPIPWGLLLSNLIRWYDSNTIEALINNIL